MTYQEKVRYLSSYRRMVQECADIQDEIVRLEHKKERMGSSFPKMPESTSIDNKSALEELLIEIDNLENKIKGRTMYFGTILDEIEETINSIPDPSAQQLLRYRYIHGYTFERIADRMKYTDKSYVFRLHKRILNQYDFS